MRKRDRCSQCEGIILADTEDWKEPLCYEHFAAIGSPEREPRLNCYAALTELKAAREGRALSTEQGRKLENDFRSMSGAFAQCKEENAALRAEIESLVRSKEYWKQGCAAEEQSKIKLRAENHKLIEALKEISSMVPTGPNVYDVADSAIQIAKEALKAYESGEK